MEHRQGEGRLGDEDVARHRLEGRAGRRPAGACSRRTRRCAGPCIRAPPAREPRIWPAGTRLTSTSPTFTLSPYFSGCWDVSGMSWKRARMIASVSGVASALRWPGRAWSPWPWVITARGHRHGGIDIEVAGLAIEAARRRIEPRARVQGVSCIERDAIIPARYGASRPVCTLVRKPRLDAAAAPARPRRAGPAGQERAADRADRRRQDAGGLPAVARRAHRAPPRRQGSRPRQGQGRAAHALHLAAEGAGDRHPPQPRRADRRDAAAGARREPDRRHAAKPAAAPARAAAGPADDHAGIAGAAAVLSRRREVLRQPALRDHRRAACLRHVPSAAISWRSAWRGWRRWRPRRASSACRPRSPIRRCSPTSCACATTSRSRSCTASRARRRRSTIIDAHERLPWGGHMGQHAVPEVYNIIRQHQTSIVFVNTRAQAELVFHGLWRINDDNLAIGLHHGSLAVEQRRKVEAAMAARQAARRGGDLVARSRHRLGRCRPGDPDGRAQGREPPDAAHRPRQPPARRAEPRHARAGQPLRGAGIAGGAAKPSRRASSTAIRRGRPASTCWRSTSCGTACAQPIDREALFHEVRRAAALSRPAAQGLRRHVRFRRRPAAMRWRPTSAGTG